MTDTRVLDDYDSTTTAKSTKAGHEDSSSARGGRGRVGFSDGFDDIEEELVNGTVNGTISIAER